jgi:hypothetical protein
MLNLGIANDYGIVSILETAAIMNLNQIAGNNAVYVTSG